MSAQSGNRYAELCAAQQAPIWATEPSGFKSSFDTIVRLRTLWKTKEIVRQEMIGLCL
jgi:hypothetical protein